LNVFFSLGSEKSTWVGGIKLSRTLFKRAERVLMFYRREMKLKMKIILVRKTTPVLIKIQLDATVWRLIYFTAK